MGFPTLPGYWDFGFPLPYGSVFILEDGEGSEVVGRSALPEAGDDILNSAQEVVGKVVRSAPMLNDTASLLVELRLDNVAMDNLEHSTLAWQGHALSLHAENALLLSTGTAEG